MKTQVIPAQITTVEDKIAGNLNLTQIFLLMIPVFWMMIVYTLIYPQMHFAWYKLPILLIVSVICLILSLRIKGKVVLNWLVILIRYNSRPTYYLYDKNDSYLRTIDLPVFKTEKRRIFSKSPAKQEKKVTKTTIALGDLVRLEGLIANPKFSFSIKSGRKGGLNVAVEQNQK